MTKFNRFLSLILALILSLSLFAGSYALSVNNFKDVKSSNWYYSSVDYVVSRGYMNGTTSTTFSPQMNFSRAMLVTVLWRIENSPVSSFKNPFTDVPVGTWYTQAVVWASEKGIVGGYGDGKFGPNDPITREQMVSIFMRYAGYNGISTDSRVSLSSFTDVRLISGWASDAVNWSVSVGLVKGTDDNRLNPKGNATRAESATVLERFCKDILKSSVPAYSGSAYIPVNNNVPGFNKNDYTTVSYEKYSVLDSLGRCGTAMACIGKDLMPTEDRGSISGVIPSGWHSVEYDGSYLYNRCHLIGYQLTAENANVRNLITGTRYLNIQGMLPFENMVADYITETGNHVLYRVTPVFENNNLVASGVQIEAYSVEDNGDGISFNVYCYNVQPGVSINYKTGESSAAENKPQPDIPDVSSSDYVLNTNTKKFHYPSCYSVSKINAENKEFYTGTRENLINSGYSPCGNCDP